MSLTTSPPPAVPHAPASAPAKLFYIDNIRVILTILVVLHHTFITYGASGGWYYKEATTHIGALVPMTLFVSVNQSFFMGCFFLLAGFFTYFSYHRKGTTRFIADRLVRLGIPLLFYSFIFSPFLGFLIYRFDEGHPIGYLDYLSGFDDWIDFGVLWFVAALLSFTLFYVLCRKVFSKWTLKPIPAPGTATILFIAAGIGFLSFLVRIVFPVGWVLQPLGFQLGHFSQYIFLYTVGILAAKNKWLDQLSYHTGKQLLRVALILLLVFPLFYVISTHFKLPVAWYSGGFNGLSLLYAVWEQSIGLSIITAFLAIGKQRWNKTSPMLVFLSRHAFVVYILHPLALICLALVLRNWSIDPALKLLVVAPLGVVASFLLGAVVLRIPGVKQVV